MGHILPFERRKIDVLEKGLPPQGSVPATV
jgi:hypothetical protein